MDKVEKDPYSLIADSPEICCSQDHARKKNCQRNPWCVYGLGEGKDGIWSKNCDLYELIGDDPIAMFRPSEGSDQNSLCGIKNMGATCYLNVFLQTFFSNIMLRSAILFSPSIGDKEKTNDNQFISVESNECQVILSLQKVLCSLAAGNKKEITVEEFVGLLNLPQTMQQDPHEFHKLFLAKFEKLELPLKISGLIWLKDIFVGNETTYIRCQACDQIRDVTHESSEISLYIDKNQTIEEAIQNYEREEVLEEENSSCCPFCHIKGISFKHVVNSKSPAVLCVHLLRYKYDRNSNRKVKLSYEVTYSPELVFAGEQYVLVSVIYHLGKSAQGGHYVCDVMDWNTQLWSHCDDTNVFSLSLDDVLDNAKPHDAEIDLTKSAEKSNIEKRGKGTKRKQSSTEAESDGTENGSQQTRNMHRKKDVYLLYYVKQSLFVECLDERRLWSIPEHLRTEQEISNAIFLSSIEEYKVKQKNLNALIDGRKEKYGLISKALPPRSRSDAFHLVPKDWLRNYVIGNRGTLPLWRIADNGSKLEFDAGLAEATLPVLCPHGRLQSKFAENMKIVSSDAFNAMFNGDDGLEVSRDLLLTHANYRCAECGGATINSLQIIRAEEERINELIESVDNDIASDDRSDKLQCLSKQWLTNLKKYQAKLVKLAEGDMRLVDNKLSQLIDVSNNSIIALLRDEVFGKQSLNENLRCEHSQPAVDFAKKAHVVSEITFAKVQSLFPDGIFMSTNDSHCDICERDQHAMNEANLETKNARLQQLENKILKILANKKNKLEEVMAGEDGEYYLVEGEWMRIWRKYMSAAKNPVPPCLTNRRLKCRHKNVLVDESLLCSSNSISVNGPPDAEIVSHDQWRALISFYPLAVPDVDAEVQVCEDMDLFEAKLIVADNHISYKPEICLDCKNQLKVEQEFQSTNFENKMISICLIRDPVVLTQIADLRPAETGIGISELLDNNQPTKRTRSERSNTSKLFKVCASSYDSIGILKLKIFEASSSVDLPPNSQVLLDENCLELIDNLKTLDSYKVNWRQKLYVYDGRCKGGDNCVEAEDGWDVFDQWTEAAGSANKETGFQGTFVGKVDNGNVVYDVE